MEKLHNENLYYSLGQTNPTAWNERECSTHGRVQNCIQNFSWEIRSVEPTKETCVCGWDNIFKINFKHLDSTGSGYV
jgi:hypothetical protein